MSDSPSLSALRINKTMKWGLPEAERLVMLYMRGAAQDGFLPTTEPMNELQEKDALTAAEPEMQYWMSQPPDPSYEAQRSQAQTNYQRLAELRLKYAANG